MQTKAFVQFLLDNHLPVFTLDDAAKILNAKRGYAKLFLHRCTKRGILGSAERGVYYLNKRANEYEVASNILRPSYVSMISALYYYGLTTQIPRNVYVISTKRHTPIKDVLGFKIIFRRIGKTMMFGYHKEGNGNIFVADPEKAIVDIFYFHDVNDLSEDALEKPPRIDVDRLVLYAKRSKKRYVVSGVAGLLDEHGYASKAKALLNEIKKMK